MSHPVGIRRIDVVALFLIALAFASLTLPAADSARDAARHIQCRNNLLQIGLGVHNFHDTFNGIPPLAIGDTRPAFFIHLFPFAEQQNIYNLLNGGNEAEQKTFFSKPVPENWSLLNAEEKDATGSVKWMHCPMRRAARPVQLSSSDDADYQGPVGDYCVVFMDCDLELSGAPAKDAPPVADWKEHRDSLNAKDVERQKGAVRLATAKNFAEWKPRDTFARITDGTSLTFLVGEKHLRGSEVRKWADDMQQQDGSYFFEGNQGREYSVARNIRLPLGKAHLAFDEKGLGPDDDFGFGSQHSAGVNFLLGDGSVKTMAFDTDAKVLNKLGHAQDGLTVDLGK